MSYEFLQSYHIPLLPKTAEESSPTENPDAAKNSEEQPNVGISNYSRYVPPGSINPPLPRAPKRKAEPDVPEGTIVLFKGRDASYPDELNLLIEPLCCKLCDAKMNSQKSAEVHYRSKGHDRKISAWLAQNFPDHPPVKRFFEDRPTGADALHCELCDIPLTSLAHANQHYAGRKHRLVFEKKTIPSGTGYYNEEGKWIRTGFKKDNKKTDGIRFGIGVDFISKPDTTTPQVEQAAVANSSPNLLPAQQLNASPDDSLCCRLCKISVTSASQMKTHIDGAKHRKNLARLPTETCMSVPVVSPDSVKDSILESVNSNASSADLSMYRTPSGSYYCKTCDVSMCHIAGLQEHISGKKHLKKVHEEKLKQVPAK